MITRRPTLPTGYALPSLPVVIKAMHVDDGCELYRLGQVPASRGEALLLLVRSHAGAPESSPLEAWFARRAGAPLASARPLRHEQAVPHMEGYLLELHGQCLAEVSFEGASESQLRALLYAFIDVCEQSQSENLFPDLRPSLTWRSPDSALACPLLPLLPLQRTPPSESERVQNMALAFYRLATGMSEELRDKPPELRRWAKHASEELSRSIARCLSPAAHKDPITSFLALNRALGRMEASHAQAASTGASEPAARAAPSASGRGLARVAGMQELKELLEREVVAPVRDPEPYLRYGLSIPNGILLYGPPGCGKTYIARQLAEELDHYFVEVIPSELAGIHVHETVIKIRELFEAAAEHAPAIVFIDEFEALVPAREGLGGHQQYKSEEVNEFLAHLNACAEKKIFVIAATNRAEKIDAAVRRTGRLDKLIYVGPPDELARREMLALHLERRPVAKGLDLGMLAKALAHYSASDLRFLVDQAARDAFSKREDIGAGSFAVAMERIQPSVPPHVEREYRSIEQRG